MNVLVGVPVFGVLDQDRRDALQTAWAWWTHAGFDVTETDLAYRSRAAAKNAVVRELLAYTDVVVLADGDTVAPPAMVTDAVTLARSSGRLVIVGDELVKLERGQTPDTPLADPRLVTGFTGGILAIPAPVWEATGGFDERFTTWGGEDRAFAHAANILHGPNQRTPGRIWHLWHQPDPQSWRAGHRAQQLPLADRYLHTLDPDTLRLLLSEPGAPFGPPAPEGEPMLKRPVWEGGESRQQYMERLRAWQDEQRTMLTTPTPEPHPEPQSEQWTWNSGRWHHTSGYSVKRPRKAGPPAEVPA